MNKEKFEVAKETLRKLLAIQQQHEDKTFNKTQADKAIYESLDGLIADAAADLLEVYEEDEKSEMLCNCADKDKVAIEEASKAFEDFTSAMDKIIDKYNH